MNLKDLDLQIHNCELTSAKLALFRLLGDQLSDEITDAGFEVMMKLLMVLSELQDSASIDGLANKIIDHKTAKHKAWVGRLNYFLAMRSAYQGDLKSALQFCQLSIEASVDYSTSVNADQLALTLAGRLACYSRLGHFEVGLKDVERLEILKDGCKDINTKVAVELNKADFFSRLGNQALAWIHIEAAKILIRRQKSLLNHIKLIIIKSEIYERSKNLPLAIEALEYADSLCDPLELSFRSFRIRENLQRLKNLFSENQDLIIDPSTRTVLEKKLGRVDLGQQHLVHLLLSQLSTAAGQIVSKSEICKHLWNESYNSETHDNKIYVTIKRLRNLIEPDPHKPKYIHRARGGYYLEATAALSSDNMKF